jgi:hypothetical protein
MSRALAAVPYRHEATVHFMEASGSESSDERGQIDAAISERVIGGRPDRHSRLLRQTAGKYQYEIRDRSHSTTGYLQTHDLGGLPAEIAIASRKSKS